MDYSLHIYVSCNNIIVLCSYSKVRIHVIHVQISYKTSEEKFKNKIKVIR